jgi:branched-chain amino acid transport system substrate-binding protein
MALENTEGQGKTSPLRGEGKGGGERLPEMPFLPLTLTLSPKGRGEVIFNNTTNLQRRRIMKKRIIFSVLLLAGLIVNPVASFAADNPKVFKLGFITSLSGPLAASAETQRKAAVLIVDQVNKKGGLNMPWGKIKVEMLVKDDEMKLDVGVRRFRELVEAGIHGASGTIYNPMAGALNEECKLKGMPYIPACVPAIESFKKGNPAVATYAVAFTPWSIGYLEGDALIRGMNKKRIFWQGRPDSWGTVMLEGLRAAAKDMGGEIVGVEENQRGTLDYSAVINKALAVKPDVFSVNMFGGDAVACIKQAYDMGLHKVSMLFNTWTLLEVGMGIPEAALAEMYALTYYYYDLKDYNKELAAKGKALVEDHMKMYGEPPDAYAVLAYTAVSVLFQAVEKAKSVDPQKIGKVLAESTFDTVKGPAKFRIDHQLTGDSLAFLVKGKKASEKKEKWDVFKVLGVYGGDKALPPLKNLGY